VSKLDEKKTRKRLIDPLLRSAGWKVVPYDPEKPLSDYDGCAVEEYPTRNGPADYGLCVQNRILGIVEAKKLTQAILAKAFRGELVPTEAELARREGREYEPAWVLLERIRAEREAKTASSAASRGRRRRQQPAIERE
jgi:hypothetical protein